MTRMSRPFGRLVLATSLALGVAACSSDDGYETTGASVQAGAQIAPQAFADYASQPGVVILDVRTPQEFAEGHLAGAVSLDVESASFDRALAALDPAASYAVYCRTGNRSRVAIEKMTAQGIVRTLGLDGGIVAWTRAGRSIVTN